MKTIEVVAGIIQNRENKIMIARRKEGKSFAGKWEFPGGKIEDETPENALIRELFEEFGIITETEKFFAENIHDYQNFRIKLKAYFSKYISGEIRLTDHDEVKWVEIKELRDFDFSEADVPFIKKLQNLT